MVCIGCNLRRVALYNCSKSCEQKPTKKRSSVEYSEVTRRRRCKDNSRVAQMCVSVHCIWSWTILYVTVQKAYRCPIRKGDGTGCAHTMLSVSLSRSSQKLWERGWLPFLESSRQKCLPGQNNSMQCYKMTPMSRYPIFKFQGQKGTRIWFRRRKIREK